MARFMYLGNNFTGGQVSPLIFMRSDFTRHKNGAEILKNLTVLPQGGVTSRVGGEYIAAVKNSADNTVLIPFEASTDDAYMVEAGDQYFRFYKNGAQLESGGSAYEVSHPYAASEVEDIRWVQSNDVLFLHHGDYPPRKLSRTADTSWTLALDEQTDGPYLREDSSGATLTLSANQGTVTVTASSPIFATTDTSGTGGTGESDRLIRIQNQANSQPITAITKANPVQLTYSGGDFATDNDTIYISGVGGMTELNSKTYSDIELNNNGGTDNLELKDIDSTNFTTYTSGGTIQTVKSEWIWLKITGYTSSTVVTAEIQGDEIFGSLGPLKSFRLGAWATTTGYPWMGVFYENRLVRARTDNEIGKLWASAVDGFNDYAPGTDDDNSWDFTLASSKLDAIQWMTSQRQLRVGTAGSEYTLDGGSTQSSITPTNVRVRKETENGSLFFPALPIRNSTLFTQRSKKKLHEFVYDFNTDGFVDPDLTLAADDIARAGVKRLAFQREPYGIVWACLEDGSLIGLTYMRDQDVVAWHQHQLGGTDVKVKDVSAIPGETETEIWMVVERTIDGSTVKYVEKLDTEFRDKTVNDARFSDSFKTITGEEPAATLTPAAITGTVIFTAGSSVFSATDVGREIRSGTAKAIITAYTSGTEVTARIVVDFPSTSAISAGDWTISSDTVTGLDHLEGEVVTILADGAVHPDRAVAGGSITLNAQYTKVHVGLGYTQQLKTLHIDSGSAAGSSYGSRSRTTTLTLRFFETVGCNYRASTGSLKALTFRNINDISDEGVPLFTGEKEVKPGQGWGDQNWVEITQNQPLPLTLLGYVAKIEVSDAS